jgi:RNA polymerase sigma-70 factor (ECF subfamily)
VRAGQEEVRPSTARRTALKTIPTREERFNALYAEHVEAIRRYVWRRDPQIADDVVAETFLIAWRRLHAMPNDERPWLIGVARNVRLNIRRGAVRQEALSERLLQEQPQPGTVELHAGEAVKTALSLLPEADQEVLLLAVWDDLDRGQIARALGCSKSTVSVRLHRARRRLSAALAGLAGDDCIQPPTLVPGGASDA